MQKSPPKFHWMIVLIWLLTSCAPQAASGAGPQAWIDAPLDGMQLPLAPYEIVAHAEYPTGISQFEFSINGSVIATTAGGAGSLSTVRQMWNITSPGNYVVSVRAMGNSGVWSETVAVKVNVYDTQFHTPVTPTGTAPPLPTPTITPVPIPTFVLIQNANCRIGPGQVFNEVGAAYKGDSVPIEGRNEDGTWWLVRLPNGTLCWVSGATGNATVNYSDVPFAQSSPMPEPTQVLAPSPVPQAQGCYVYDANQQQICTVPCPANAQPGGACTP